MNVLKLSLSVLLIYWGNKVVDWFMVFFEDADLYWTDDFRKKELIDTFSLAKAAILNNEQVEVSPVLKRITSKGICAISSSIRVCMEQKNRFINHMKYRSVMEHFINQVRFSFIS